MNEIQKVIVRQMAIKGAIELLINENQGKVISDEVLEHRASRIELMVWKPFVKQEKPLPDVTAKDKDPSDLFG